jgi:S-DNA-T family DNA segregation ATPase FtsK/SpoIIIE
LLADPHRKLLPSVPESYRCGFAIDAESLAGRVQEAVVSMQRRLPGTDIPPERLDRRDWWSGPRLFLVVDDLDFFVSGGQSPLAPLAPLLGHGRNIGLHLVVARSTSGGPRILVDPVVRRLWELGSPALLFSYPKEEGKFLGEARPRTLPAGRAQLVTRRSVGLIHTALAD